MEQLTITLYPDEIPAEGEDPSVEALFKPNGRRKCPACRQPMKPFGGRLYCLRAGCTGVPR